jgi:predicted nucleotidyltransferase
MVESDRFLQLDFSLIGPYLERLLAAYPNIESVWLIGSRANETARDDSDWDLLVFASREVLEALSTDDSFSRSDVDLLVVYDGDNFESPYGGTDNRRSKKGSLKEWEWQLSTPDIAYYEGCKPTDEVHIHIEQMRALRVWAQSDETFRRYARDYQTALNAFSTCLAETTLPRFEALTLRCMHALETGVLKAPDEVTTEFFNSTMCRLVNECHGFTACLKAGAEVAAYHHVRAILELYAALNYVFSSDQEKHTRCLKFSEFHGLSQYNHYMERSHQLNQRTINQEEFNRTCKVSKEKYDQLRANVTTWTDLWKVSENKLSQIVLWHKPDTIKSMLRALDQSDIVDLYEFFCHGTHLSPSSSRMTHGLRIIGFAKLDDGSFNLHNVEDLTTGMIAALQRILILLHRRTDNPLLTDIVFHDVELR